MEKELIGAVGQDQIDAWKASHKNGIYSLEADGHVGYFKNPSRIDMNCAMSKASMESPLDMYDDLARQTWLGGSDALLNDDEKFFGVTQQLKVKMDGKKAVLKNL